MRIPLITTFLLTALSAQAAVLDFDDTTQAMTTPDSSGFGPVNPAGTAGAWISQTYGDVPGLVDVTYSYFAPGSATSSSTLQTYFSGYDDLNYVAWFGTNVGGDRAQVRLASVNDSVVRLDSFDLGIWSGGRGPGTSETVTVYEIGQTTPVFIRSFSENNNLRHSFNIGLQSSSGFVIEWTNPWWVAIDNLSSTAIPTPIPEPGAWALMAAGLLIVGAAARRR